MPVPSWGGSETLLTALSGSVSTVASVKIRDEIDATAAEEPYTNGASSTGSVRLER